MPVNTRRCLQFLVIGRHRPRQSVDAAVSYVRHTAWSVCVGRVEQERMNRPRSSFGARVGARNFHHRLFAVCRNDFVGVPRGNWEEVIYRAYACDQIRLSAKVDAITKVAVRYVLMRPFAKLLCTLVITQQHRQDKALIDIRLCRPSDQRWWGCLSIRCGVESVLPLLSQFEDTLMLFCVACSWP